MNSAKLTRIIYASSAIPGILASDLTAILEVARRNNSQRSITGMLLYTSGSFFQVLEGEESILVDLLKIIASDPRHSNVTKIIQEPIAQRDFGDWTMGFSEIESTEFAEVVGLSDFFQEGTSLTKLASGRAKKLLAAFAQGRWRARLEGNAK